MAPIMIATAWSAIMENSTVRACRRFISAGTVGRDARAIGMACLPMLSAFAVNEVALPVRYVA